MLAHLFPPWPQLGAFLLAVSVLALTPGPAVVFIVTRSLVAGRAQGVATVAGVALGNLLACQAACAGVALLFVRWPGAFLALRLLGGVYLVFLGVQAWRTPPASDPRRGSGRPGRPFREGLWVAASNPKTYIFMAAFLPQFLSAGSGYPQLAVLGVIGPSLTACSDLGYALAADALGRRLGGAFQTGVWSRWVGGAVFCVLGATALGMGLLGR